MTLTISLDRPARTGRLTARIPVFARRVRAFGAALVAPHKASLRRLADIPLTVAGLALGDAGSFIELHGWGYAITAASLLVLEHLIADPD